MPGFNYSSALKKAGDNGLVWTKANLEKWLTDPRSMVPGTRMVFPGIKDKGERDNVIAYLQSITPPK